MLFDLNVRHPLAACGKPDRAYGLLVDYLDPAFKKLLIGFEVRAYKILLLLIRK